MTTIDEIVGRFREKCDEVIYSEVPKNKDSSDTKEFGYKAIRRDGDISETFNVIDFTNMEKFIRSQLLSLIGEVEGKVQAAKLPPSESERSIDETAVSFHNIGLDKALSLIRGMK